MGDVEREAHVDVALWATVPPRGPIEDVQALVAAGAAAFKLSTFETHPERFPRIPDGQLLAAFAAIAAAGGLAGVHAENDEIVRAGIAAEIEAGHGGDPLAHARSRPPVAEHEAIARVLELARATGVRLHVCHVSTPRGVELVAAARRDGVDVSAETCPHYLLLDESELRDRGGEAKINPPLRASCAAGRRARPDLLRPRRLAGGAQARAGHLRPGLGRPGGRADRAPGPRRARRGRAGAAGQRSARAAVRPVAAQGQPDAGGRCRPARARPAFAVGDRPGAAGHPGRLEPVRGPPRARPRDRRLLAGRAGVGRSFGGRRHRARTRPVRRRRAPASRAMAGARG